MAENDPIINGALRDLVSTDSHIIEAERMIKILSEAGEDVTQQRSQLAQMKARRDKLVVALRNNGANIGD